MIVTVFLYIFLTIILFFLGLLPDIVVSSNLTNTISTMSGYISSIYSFLPSTMTAILGVLAFDLAFEGGYLLFKIVYWIIKRLPTQS